MGMHSQYLLLFGHHVTHRKITDAHTCYTEDPPPCTCDFQLLPLTFFPPRSVLIIKPPRFFPPLSHIVLIDSEAQRCLSFVHFKIYVPTNKEVSHQTALDYSFISLYLSHVCCHIELVWNLLGKVILSYDAPFCLQIIALYVINKLGNYKVHK